VLIAGHGARQATAQVLALAERLGGQDRQGAARADFPVWHTSLRNPDWAAYAELCGATGIKAVWREQLDAAMARLFAADGPAMLHVEQDPELL
jgi:thiamine pyrophosphate-dependent acetolactate synthase large subunit-like protein